MKWLGYIGLLVFVPNAQAAITFSDDFESGRSTEARLDCDNYNEKFKIQGSIVRNGNKAALMVNDANGGKRCELVPQPAGRFFWGREYWVGYSFYIPSNLPNTGFKVFHQHHSAPPKGVSCGYSGGNGFLLIRGKSGQLEIRITPEGQLTAFPEGSAGGNTRTAYSFPYETNKWFDVVMNFKYSDKGDGFWKIWIDGKQVINKNGSNVNLYMTPDNTRSYSDCGDGTAKRARIYDMKYGTYAGNSEAGAVVYDEVKIGDVNSSYEEVAPANGKSISNFAPKNTPYRTQSSPSTPLTVPKGLELEIK
ncbi:MAG: polysaccharide lyase [Gammaproteobacteria bacterium]|nr:polysaccharide lyase [Gammaproteobacteria bacterium]